MKLGITLDEVLRDTIKSLIKTFDDYKIGKYDSIQKINIENLSSSFKIDEDYIDSKDLNDLLINKGPLEVFGLAEVPGGVKTVETLNDYLYDFSSEEENKATLIIKHVGRQLPATYYFLGKHGIELQNTKNYLINSHEVWDDYDVIITANPSILKSKPTDKTVIKIKTHYNKHLDADYTYDSLNDALLGDFLKEYR